MRRLEFRTRSGGGGWEPAPSRGATSTDRPASATLGRAHSQHPMSTESSYWRVSESRLHRTTPLGSLQRAAKVGAVAKGALRGGGPHPHVSRDLELFLRSDSRCCARSGPFDSVVGERLALKKSKARRRSPATVAALAGVTATSVRHKLTFRLPHESWCR